MGGCPGVESIEQKAKALSRRRLAVAKRLEDLKLHVRAMIAQATGAKFYAIEDQVVMRAPHAVWGGGQQTQVLVERRHKRHMHIRELAIVGFGEERKIKHKERIPVTHLRVLKTRPKVEP